MARVRINTGGDEDKQDYPPPAPPAQEVLPTPVGPDGLRLCDTGAGVSTLQVRLGIPATGEYDQVTDYTVRIMQETMGMEVTGVATAEFHGRMGLPYPPLNS